MTHNEKFPGEDELFEAVQKIFNKLDKMIDKEFGEMCHSFEPECPCCRVYAIYNIFKKDLNDELFLKHERVTI